MESVKVYLLDKNNEVQYGLNWGQREGREPNQAYLQLAPEVYRSDFFPVKNIISWLKQTMTYLLL